MSCRMCVRKFEKQYSSCIHTFDGNRINETFYFCRKECMDKFNKTKKCYFCSYYGDLKEIDGYMVCISPTNSKYSCIDKYELKKKYGIPIGQDMYDRDYDFMVNNKCPPTDIQHLFLELQNNYANNVIEKLVTLEKKIKFLETKLDTFSKNSIVY